VNDAEMTMDDATHRPAGKAHQRDLARQRSDAYRSRRRRGAVLVTIEPEPHDLTALERLALLEHGDRDPCRMAVAAAQFLAAVPYVAAMGDALWPEQGEGGA
jgi:hypothetical protein